MDRDAVEYQLRLVYAAARDGKDPVAAARTAFELDALGRLLLGRSFRFEPDMNRTTDATPARMSGLRPVASAAKPSLSVIAGGAQPHERPSERFIDDSADDAPKAG